LPIYVAQFPLAPFNSEKSLRTNEAGLTELAAFKIAAIQRNRESIASGLRSSFAQHAPHRNTYCLFVHENRAAVTFAPLSGVRLLF
jgi:hypothetical protein